MIAKTIGSQKIEQFIENILVDIIHSPTFVGFFVYGLSLVY